MSTLDQVRAVPELSLVPQVTEPAAGPRSITGIVDPTIAKEKGGDGWLRRLAIVTDAWHPQTNGVVNTLDRLSKHLEAQGIEVLVIAPDAHRTLPLPSYSEIRVAWDP